MPRRTFPAIGVVALLCALLTPAAAHAAPTWQSFAEPLFADVLGGTIHSADVEDGRAVVVHAAGSTSLNVAEREPGEGGFTTRTLPTGTLTAARAIVSGATTTVAWVASDGIHIRARADGEYGPAQDVGGSAVGGLELVELSDGTVLLGQVDGTVARLWRRSPGATTFNVIPSVAFGGGESVQGIALRAGPDGSAALALRTQSTAVSADPIAPTVTTSRVRVARMLPGAASFGAAEEATAPLVVSSGIGMFNTGSMTIEDLLVRAGGEIDVAVRRAESFMIITSTVALSVAHRTTAGTWSTDAVGTPVTGSAGITGALSTLHLVPAGAETVAAWTATPSGPPGTMPSSILVARASADYTSPATLETAPAADGLLLLDAEPLDGERGLLLVRRGAEVRAVTLAASGSAVEQSAITVGTGQAQTGLLGADGEGSALAAVTRNGSGGVSGYAALLEPPAAPVDGGGDPGGGGAGAGGGGAGGGGAGGGAAAGGAGAPVKPAAPAQADRTPPRLTGVKLSRATLARRGKGRSATLSWNADEAGRLTVTILRPRGGWTSGSRCVAKRPTRGGGRRCDLVLGTVKRDVTAGPGTLTLTPKVAGRTLAAGRYRVTLVMTDLAGTAGRSVTVPFGVKR